MSTHGINNRLRYCAFCGNPLNLRFPVMRFCPFCGNKLPEAQAAGEDIVAADDGAGKGPVRPLSEHNVPGQIPAVQCDGPPGDGFYSVVLKYCDQDGQSLVKKLREILLRSPRAIQLALESVPCVLIYKERAEKALKVLNVCRNAGAAAVLLATDMNVNAYINTVYGDFHKLSQDMQIFLQSFPHKLWIGENIAGIYPVFTQDKGKGALVVGEHALYFLGRQYDWLAVSYHQLQGIFITQDALEIEYAGSKDTELFFFTDNSLLEEAFAKLQTAREQDQGRWQLDIRCEDCGFGAREGLAVLYDTCPQCSRQLIRKINEHKGLI